MARTRGPAVLAAVLLLIVGLGALGWWLRGDLWRMWQGETVAVEISPEAAAQAEDKLERLREDGQEVSLSSTELSSLLRYRSPVWVTNTVGEPEIALAGDTLVLSGTVPTDQLPSHPQLEQVRPLLPDTSRFEIMGHVRPLGAGRAALEVSGVEFAGLPVPERFFPDLLRRIGRRDEPGLAQSALAVDLPPGVGSARVERGLLILSP